MITKIVLFIIFFLIGIGLGFIIGTTENNEEMKALKLIEKYIKENKDE